MVGHELAEIFGRNREENDAGNGGNKRFSCLRGRRKQRSPEPGCGQSRGGAAKVSRIHNIRSRDETRFLQFMITLLGRRLRRRTFEGYCR
jgi:hypothetical protein